MYRRYGGSVGAGQAELYLYHVADIKTVIRNVKREEKKKISTSRTSPV